MKCKICGSHAEKFFSAVVRNKHKAEYFLCPKCGFLFVGEPFWLEEAYKNPINISDTGIVQRNLALSKAITPILYYLFDKDASFLDLAGGTGLFVRLMRDIGFDFYWQDVYAENVFARGFEYNGQTIELVTCFEAFEHFVFPRLEIEKILDISKNLLFTTDLLPQKVPLPGQWWYYGPEHGQHVSFYSRKTLEFLALKFKLHLYSRKNFHLLTEKKLNKFFTRIFFGSRKNLLDKLVFKNLSKIAEKKMKSKTYIDAQKMSLCDGE